MCPTREGYYGGLPVTIVTERRPECGNNIVAVIHAVGESGVTSLINEGYGYGTEADALKDARDIGVSVGEIISADPVV